MSRLGPPLISFLVVLACPICVRRGTSIHEPAGQGLVDGEPACRRILKSSVSDQETFQCKSFELVLRPQCPQLPTARTRCFAHDRDGSNGVPQSPAVPSTVRDWPRSVTNGYRKRSN